MSSTVAGKLTGKITLVTGASRGIGKGIAKQLGAAGATVYITGRSQSTLDDCCMEINKAGGIAKPVVVDHSNDAEVEELFNRIAKENDGKLDLLVNNAYAGVTTIQESRGKKFYDTPAAGVWDTINGVGLRNHYLCTVFASRIMTKRQSGLIINISSPGGLKYLFNVAYGIGKVACDRMANDCAVELKDKNVTMISLWPGPVLTELVSEGIASKR